MNNSLEVNDKSASQAPAPVPVVGRAKKRNVYPRLAGGRQRSFQLSKTHDQAIDREAATGGVSKAEAVRSKLTRSIMFDNALTSAAMEVSRACAAQTIENDPEMIERVILASIRLVVLENLENDPELFERLALKLLQDK